MSRTASSFAAYGRNPSTRQFMSPDGETWIAYRRLGGLVIALGGPEGAQAQAQLYEGFQRWVAPRPVVWYGAGGPRPGMRALSIGQEAIVPLQRFTLDGRPMANLRHSVAAAQRAGLELWEGAGNRLPGALRAELAAIDREWSRRRPIRLRFSLSTFEEAAADSRPWSVVRSATRTEAFASWLPSPDGSGWILDLMRRRPDAAPGGVELALVSGICRARSGGRDWVSLGLARPGEGDVTSRLARAFNPASLRAFKRKFRPDWEDRFLLFPDSLAPLAALLAVGWLHGVPAGLPRLTPRTGLAGAAAAAAAAFLVASLSGAAPAGVLSRTMPSSALPAIAHRAPASLPTVTLGDGQDPGPAPSDADRTSFQSGT